MNIGERIQKLRKSKKLTQSELAQLSGVTKTTIFNFESNLRNPKIQNLIDIAKALNTPLAAFFTDDQSIVISKSEYEELIKVKETLERIIK
jgi:transcriptional regulator with XRE-family HTH domain